MDHAFMPVQPGSTKCKWCNYAESAHWPAEELEQKAEESINSKKFKPRIKPKNLKEC